MSALLRHKSLNSQQMTEKVIDFNEILLLKDLNAKQRHLNQLLTHLVSNTCLQTRCHDLSQLLSQLMANLVQFKAFDEQIDGFLKDFNVFEVKDIEVIKQYFHVIHETINLKPFKCNQMLGNVVINRFNGFKQYSQENEIQSQEVLVFNEIHLLLSQIKLSKFESNLFTSIDRKFPFIFSPMVTNHSYLCFVYNVLKTCDYVSNKYKLMSFLTEKLLEMDSKISSAKSSVTEEMFSIDDCNASKAAPDVQKLIDALDNSMNLLFEFIDSQLKTTNEKQLKEFYDLFNQLFVKNISTLKPQNHLQYVWLYLSSLSKTFFDQFIQFVWSFGLNDENSVEMRERVLYFISSLLKNSNLVAINTVISFMNMTSLWIQRYIDTNDRTVDQLTTNDTIFYIICQILFDIFCAIHSDLDNQSLRRVKAMNFQRIIKSKLNPLAFCCPEIESRFLLLARHYQIGYCVSNGTTNHDRLRYPTDLLNNGSFVCPKSLAKIEKCCKFSMNSENTLNNEISKFNAFHNQSDESDHTMSSYKLSYSPSKSLWQNLLSDSSPNEHKMDLHFE